MSAAPRPELVIDRAAPRHRRELDDAAWVELVAGFVRQPEELCEQLITDVPWRQGEVLRYDRYVPERRLGAALHPNSLPVLRQTDLHLRSTYGAAFSGVTALNYRTGEDFQGLHSDREMRWLDDTLIAIVVLGVRRPFVIRQRGSWVAAAADRVPAGQDPDDIILMPGDGDLLVMGGSCQRDWLHGVPAAPTDRPRVSLTWRWSSRRGRPDTNPGYFDGLQYSDQPRRDGYRTRRGDHSPPCDAR